MTPVGIMLRHFADTRVNATTHTTTAPNMPAATMFR